MTTYARNHTTGATYAGATPPPAGWQESSVLARSIVDEGTAGALSTREIDTLFTAITSGLPILLTTLDKVHGLKFTDTNTVVVDAFHTGSASSARIRVRYWGFSHDVYLSSVVSIHTPSVESTTLDDSDAPDLTDDRMPPATDGVTYRA